MKYFGSILEFTHERNKELLRVYREKCIESEYIVMTEIFEKVANSPCSRFWVSEERASIVIYTMLAKKPLPNMRKNKREMFEEIFRRFLVVREQYPQSMISQLW